MREENSAASIHIQHTYTTQQVAERLGIGKSTVSKYCRSLEECGYTFYKTEGGLRAYVESDVEALNEMKALLSSGTEYNNAVLAICDKHKRDSAEYHLATSTDVEPNIESVETLAVEMREFMDRQGSLAREIVRRLDEQNRLIAEQQRYIEETIKTRDLALTEGLRKIVHNKRAPSIIDRLLGRNRDQTDGDK